MNAKALLEWEQKNDAKNRTIQGFWNCFNSWRASDRKDYLETFKGKLYEEFISAEEREIYLKYRYDMVEAFIFFCVNIFYLDKQIGTYEIEFFLDGKVADEYLDFGDKLLESKIEEIRHNIKTARKALKLGIDISVIKNITGIDEGNIKILQEKYC
jgi:hypothetical protein